jgi:hypothetical protein
MVLRNFNKVRTCESFAKATKVQANTILEWERVRASKAKRLIAFE